MHFNKKGNQITLITLCKFFLTKNYIFFLVVSAIFILLVSCLAVSGCGLVAVSGLVLVVESAAEVDFEPEQEAKDTAKTNAKAPNFSVFFIFLIVISLNFNA